MLGSSSNLDHRFRTGFLYRRRFRILAKSARTKRRRTVLSAVDWTNRLSSPILILVRTSSTQVQRGHGKIDSGIAATARAHNNIPIGDIGSCIISMPAFSPDDRACQYLTTASPILTFSLLFLDHPLVRQPSVKKRLAFLQITWIPFTVILLEPGVTAA